MKDQKFSSFGWWWGSQQAQTDEGLGGEGGTTSWEGRWAPFWSHISFILSFTRLTPTLPLMLRGKGKRARSRSVTPLQTTRSFYGNSTQPGTLRLS